MNVTEPLVLWFINVTSLSWASSRENLYSEVCDQVRLKQAYSALEASYILESLDLASRGIILSKQ